MILQSSNKLEGKALREEAPRLGAMRYRTAPYKQWSGPAIEEPIATVFEDNSLVICPSGYDRLLEIECRKVAIMIGGSSFEADSGQYLEASTCGLKVSVHCH